MTLQQVQSEHRRRRMLDVLKDSPGYTLNAIMLASACNAAGITSTRDQVAAEARWLEGLGFVSLEEVEGFMVVRLTEAGIDVAEGRRFVDGIARPRAS